MSAAPRVERLPARTDGPPRRLGRLLREGRAEAHRFLPAIPGDEAAWRREVEEAARGASRPPPALVEALAGRQAALGAGPRAEAHARALAEPGTVAVVTGQQPGLFGGPLLTLHKIAGALHLARRLDGTAGSRVVPLFWVASEDHDLVEANRLCLLDRRGQARRLALPLRPDGRSLMHVGVSEEMAEALRTEASQVLPDTPRAREALALTVPPPSATLSTWSTACVARLLGDQGLVLVEPEVLLPHAGEAHARLLEEATRIRGAVAEAGAALREAGFEAPLAIAEGDAPLFLRDAPEGRRQRVGVGPDGRVRLRGRRVDAAADEVARRLRARPELGSGDAVGRVFVQNRLLPVLGYVAGPTEIAYHAQVRAAHDAVGLRYPLAIPRPAATWVDAKSERTAAAFGLGLAEVLAALQEPEAARPVPPGAEAAKSLVDAWRTQLDGWVEKMQTLAGGEGEGPARLRRALRRMRREGHRAADEAWEALMRDLGAGPGRWARLSTLLRPQGRPQERRLSPFSLVARHGLEAVREALAALDPLASGHYLIRLP